MVSRLNFKETLLGRGKQEQTHKHPLTKIHKKQYTVNKALMVLDGAKKMARLKRDNKCFCRLRNTVGKT